MNLQTLTTLMKMQQAIGEALTKEQQLFVSANYHDAVAFLHSDNGKAAVQMFVEEWQKQKSPK